MKILAIILTILALSGSTAVVAVIFSYKFNQLSNQIIESEHRTRDSLSAELKIIRSDRDSSQNIILSLSDKIKQSDININYQIKSLKNDVFKNLKNYRDSSSIQLLERLRTN
jgi:predicted PurR-regulated permease PerM